MPCQQSHVLTARASCQHAPRLPAPLVAAQTVGNSFGAGNTLSNTNANAVADGQTAKARACAFRHMPAAETAPQPRWALARSPCVAPLPSPPRCTAFQGTTGVLTAGLAIGNADESSKSAPGSVQQRE